MILKPFLSYYGAKWRLAKTYPAPRYDVVVEPFAGAAGYAVRHHRKRVVLIDLNPVVVGVWRFLIRSSPADVLRIPLLEPGQSTDDLPVCQEARWLVGFACNAASTQPKKTLGKWAAADPNSPRLWSTANRARVASQVDAIKHWRVLEGSYDTLDPVAREATWFVDPPYQRAGTHYPCSSKAIDFERLGTWCRRLPGQVIACENEGADWLPFRPHRESQSATARSSHNPSRKSREVVWLSDESRETPGHRPASEDHEQAEHHQGVLRAYDQHQVL